VKKLLGYLSFRGRSNRARFWLTTVAVWVITFVGAAVSVGLTSLSPFLAVLFLPIYLAAIVASLANGARRLHDRGKSAWWLILFVGLPVLLLMPAEIARAAGPEAAAFPALFALLSLPISIWAFVEMGCLRGTSGPNKYGDDPLQPTQEVFA
jgi:uncharacterized membrane protein YhaH (DUF805 family)